VPAVGADRRLGNVRRRHPVSSSAAPPGATKAGGAALGVRKTRGRATAAVAAGRAEPSSAAVPSGRSRRSDVERREPTVGEALG
jgi:hypothetical protein